MAFSRRAVASLATVALSVALLATTAQATGTATITGHLRDRDGNAVYRPGIGAGVVACEGGFTPSGCALGSFLGAQTDSSGSFTLEVDAGSYQVSGVMTVTAGDSCSLGGAGVNLTIGDGEVVDLDALHPSGTAFTLGGHITGTVTGPGPGFAPVENAVVAVNQGCGFVNVATTLANGSYTAPFIPQSTYQVRVTPPAASGLPTGSSGVVLGTSDSQQDFTLGAPPVQRLITVVPSSGLSDGQQVLVSGSGWTPGSSITLFECKQVEFAPGQSPCGHFVSGAATVEAAGTFQASYAVPQQFDAVNDGDNTIWDCASTEPCQIVAANFAANEFSAQTISFGAPPPTGTATINGTIQTPDGSPLPGIQVSAVACQGGFGPTGCAVGPFIGAPVVLSSGGSVGTFTFNVSAGSNYQVAAVIEYAAGQPALGSGAGTPVLVAGEVLNLDPVTLGGPLEGTVTTTLGAVPGAEVAVNQGGGFVKVATTDAYGHYTTPFIPQSTYQVRVTPAGSVIEPGLHTGVAVGAGTVTHDFVLALTATDTDGVPDIVESGAPAGCPTCPVGDGNGDTIPDSEQQNVTSLPNGVNAQYVTLVAPEGTELVSVEALAPFSQSVPPPSGSTMPVGIFDFTVTGVTGTVEVKIYLPAGTNVDAYFKFQDNAWQQFAGAVFSGSQITLTLVDNGAGDDDPTLGVIHDPSGPARVFDWFASPVNNLPIVNTLKAGAAVPVKFSLGGDRGLDIFAAGYPVSVDIACDSDDELDGIETTVTAGTSGLLYDAASDRYTYVWKTDKTWAGTCRQLVLKLSDGTLHRANFKLT